MPNPIPNGGPSSPGLPNHPAAQPGAPSVTLPKKLGAFELLEKLGEGGMGFVHKGRQDGLDRIVAVKILTPNLAMDPIFVARFHREAKAAAVLEHPNVVRIYASGEENGFHYFATEFMDGGSVEDLVDKHRLIPPRRALEIVQDVTGALAFASSHGIVHRDIKPANLLLSNQGCAKLADLGLAKRTDSDQSVTHLTQAGMIMGTPYYMAPEQALDEEKLDVRADIYALGITLFQMLTGQVPFTDASDDGENASAMVIMTRKVNKQVPSVRTLNPAIGQPLADLCSRMTANDRNQRYPDANTLLAECSSLLAGQVPGTVATNQSTSGALTPVPAAASTSPNAIPPALLPTPINPMAPAATPTTQTPVPPARRSTSRSSRAVKRAPRRRHPTSGSRRVARGARSGSTSSTRLAAVLAGRERSQIPPWAWLGIGAGVAAVFMLGMAIFSEEPPTPQSNSSAHTPSAPSATANSRRRRPAPATPVAGGIPNRPRRGASTTDYRLAPSAAPEPTAASAPPPAARDLAASSPAMGGNSSDDPDPTPPSPVVRVPAPSIQPVGSPQGTVQQLEHLVTTKQWSQAIQLADDAASWEQDAELALRLRTLATVIEATIQLRDRKPHMALETLSQISAREIAEEVASDLELATRYRLVLVAESLRAGAVPQARRLLTSAREKASVSGDQQLERICNEAENTINSLEALRDLALNGPTAQANRLTRDRKQLANYVEEQQLSIFEVVLRARQQLLRPHQSGMDVPSSWAEDLEAASGELADLADTRLLGSAVKPQLDWLKAEIGRAVKEIRESRGIWISMGDPASASALTNASDQFEIKDHAIHSNTEQEKQLATLSRLPSLRLNNANNVKGIMVFFQLKPRGKAPPLISIQLGNGQGVFLANRLAAIRGNLDARLLQALSRGQQHGSIASWAEVRISRSKQSCLVLQKSNVAGRQHQLQVGLQLGESSAPQFLRPARVGRGNERNIDVRFGNGVHVSHVVIHR